MIAEPTIQSQTEFSKIIHKRREELGITVQSLAGELGVSDKYVYQIQSGEASLSNSSKIFCKLAEALMIDVETLKALRPKRRLKRIKGNPDSLGGFLASNRLKLHFTQNEVSKRTGIRTPVVCSIEKGYTYPSDEILGKLCNLLECTIPPELIPSPPSQ